eukprot:scaffold13285_cov103-Isochrysis_galbana.AAC.4
MAHRGRALEVVHAGLLRHAGDALGRDRAEDALDVVVAAKLGLDAVVCRMSADRRGVLALAPVDRVDAVLARQPVPVRKRELRVVQLGDGRVGHNLHELDGQLRRLHVARSLGIARLVERHPK